MMRIWVVFSLVIVAVQGGGQSAPLAQVAPFVAAFIPALLCGVCAAASLLLFCQDLIHNESIGYSLFMTVWCFMYGLGFILFCVATFQRDTEDGVRAWVLYGAVALVCLATVLPCLVFIIHRVGACLKNCREQQDDETHEELANFRSQLATNTNDGNVEVVVMQNAEETGNTASDDNVPLDSRSEFVKTFLYRRHLEHGGSVRTLAALLNLNDDSEEDHDGSLFIKTWKSVESSLRSVTQSTRPECSICLADYKAGETVCWAKNDDCNHLYHEGCIVKWLENHDDCPLCRTNLVAGWTQ